MKKTLLSIISAIAVTSAVAQVASPNWTTTQNANWPKVSTGVRLMSAVDANVLWAHGYDGTAGNTGRNYSWFTRTINGGNSFNSGNMFASPTNTIVGDTNSFKIASLEGVDANTCWVASYLKAGQNKGAIHRTADGGSTWQNMTAPGMYTDIASFCNIVVFVTPQIGITMGDPNPTTANEYEIWRTTNGGNTWSLIPGANIPAPSSPSEYGLTGVYTKLGSSNIWFGTNEGRIFRSFDAGVTWSVSAQINAAYSVNEIAFSTVNNGYAWLFDSAGNLYQYQTTDGGATWTAIAAVNAFLGKNNMCAIPGTSDYASCGAGTGNQIISNSQDGGVTWNDWGSTNIQYLTVDFVNSTTGWAGGFSDPTTPGLGGIYKFTGAVTSTAAPTAAFSAPPSLCTNNPTTALVNSSTGNPAPTFVWTSNPAAAFSSSTASAPTVTFSGAGTYTITLIASSTSGSATASQVVVVQACSTPTSAFSIPSQICAKKSVTVTNTSTGSPSPTYNWAVVPSTSVIISNATAATPSFSFNAVGVYSVVLLSTNASGTNAAIQTVTVSACPPNVNFNIAAAGCVTTAITTTNSTTSTITPISYSWSAQPSGNISNFTAPAPQITFTAAGIYTVTLLATNVSGAASITRTISISDCTGLNENTRILNSISVFPNPSNGLFNLSNNLSNDNINYSVANILGSTVLTGKFNTSKSIDLSAQSKGIYFITLQYNGTKLTKKIVVE